MPFCPLNDYCIVLYCTYFCDPLHILGTAIVIECKACSVCGAFDAAFAKLLWPLVVELATVIMITIAMIRIHCQVYNVLTNNSNTWKD